MSQPELVEDLFNCPPAYNVVLACLSPADIIRLGKTCRLLRDAVASFQSLAYNINRHLEHFVSDPLALRKLQVKYKFLISGSNALQFLDRTFYYGSDLDIFVYPENVKELGSHLIDHEGYIFQHSEKQEPKYEDVAITPRNLSVLHRTASQGEFVYNSQLSDLLKFKNKKRDLEIQLISCRRSPLDCILYFHSTPVVNFITADMAYSLYPKATFDKRIALQFGYEWHEATGKAYKKYAERGWEFFSKLTWDKAKEIQPCTIPDTIRYLDDEHTWRVPLDTAGLDLYPSAKKSDSKGKSYSFSYFNGYSSTMTVGIGYEVYHSKSMEETYVFAERNFCDAANQLVDYLEEYDPSRKKGLK
ncbi:hypothetical protein FA13DRAFT_1728861 [Coprinellus micaceus]|uniref:F-box domain-containing protein n=1 Tax=Coprinellus micaceus TaxID=71717 RepID=A0A4Y7TLJ5_COPMI|nr:hypothetical protein FA13DRAFT_1728861 [Coprinellus micaceus]